MNLHKSTTHIHSSFACIVLSNHNARGQIPRIFHMFLFFTLHTHYFFYLFQCINKFRSLHSVEIILFVRNNFPRRKVYCEKAFLVFPAFFFVCFVKQRTLLLSSHMCSFISILFFSFFSILSLMRGLM